VNPIKIGLDADGAPLTLDPEVRQQTHMHVIGASGTGKSKFLEWLIRQDIDEGHGLCVIDWHGSLYEDVLRYCAFQDVGTYGDPRRLILLNPSQPDYVVGFNPFAAPGPDVSVQVSRRINATIRPWGVTDTMLTPTFARVCRVLYTFMVETGETLPNAATMLHFKNRRLRDYAASIVQDSSAKSEWEEILELKRFTDWREEVLSTKNRLIPFVTSKAVRRFMGLPAGNISLTDIMDRGDILLVNLAGSDFLDTDAARVFASLLLLDFFETAMRRGARASRVGAKPSPFLLYLDEFQEYMTDDIAGMLDQVRKGGLHMVLAHQHLGHFTDKEKLKKSVFTNARIKAVFGGLDYDDASIMAREMFLHDLNQRQIKKAYYHTIHLYREETRTVRGHSEGSGSAHSVGVGAGQASGEMIGWFDNSDAIHEASSTIESSMSSEANTDTSSSSETTTVLPVWVPIPQQELTTEAEWSREEKLDKVVEILNCQQQAHCFIKLNTQATQPLRVPTVKDYGTTVEALVQYENEVHKAQGARPSADIDRALAESTRLFLRKAGVAEEQADDPGVSDDDERWS
jgi:hypothetical protein